MQPQTVRRGTIAVAESPEPDSAETPVVLVVTPDANLREASARLLKLEGYAVITAAHAGHAVLAGLKARRVDLMVAELAMDDISGPALAARLRRQFPKLATVYLGNTGARECEGVLVRPFTRDDLFRALAAARGVTAGLTSAS
jgi:CheY-like chemotaxis protein